MSWQELEIIVDTTAVPQTEALLRLAGATAISLASGGDEELLEPLPGETPMWSSVVLRALFPPAAPLSSTAINLQIALGLETGITFRAVSEEEWKGAWERRPGTQRVGERLLLAAADEDVPDCGRVVVKLNLGLAFGTGEHPTTALCLEWLDAELQPGTRIMDYGCGSGILAIAALRLGATFGWAVDIDSQALTATRANARLNLVEEHLWMGTPDVLPRVQVDVLISNILAGTLRDLVELFARCIKPGGRLVLSGVLECQAQDLCQCYGDRFGPFTVKERDGWTLLSALRR